MTEREALKLALEALEANQPINYCMNSNGEKFPMMQEDPFRFDRNNKTITAIKEALAQPEQEPVACQHKRYSVDAHEQIGNCLDCGAEGRMRFIVGNPTPPKRKPLTVGEIVNVYNEALSQSLREQDKSMVTSFARAIEAAHGIKE